MKEFWNTIQLVFAAVGGWLGYFLGGCDGLLYALIAFVAIDYIPARRQVGNAARQQEEKPKLRVAAYCRVSTDSDEQATSYEAQVEHYTEYIQNHPDWVLAGIFADDGISGTNTKKRTEFNRMIDECMAGNIEIKTAKLIQFDFSSAATF